MPLNPSGAISLAGPVAGQSIAVELGQSATATISLNDTNVRTLAQVPSGVIVMPTDFWGKSNITGTQRAIFGYGARNSPFTRFSITNLVSSSGVVASDTPGVGTIRNGLAAAGYGGDKAIFGYGVGGTPAIVRSLTNLVSNTGVVASDTPGVGTARADLAAAGYGGDKAIFGYGFAPSLTPSAARQSNIINLVSNTGVVASNSPGVGTGRSVLAAASYGGDKAIFAFGAITAAPTFTAVTNLVSNTGVVASDTPGVGLQRSGASGAGYGGDKAIFTFGAGNAGQPVAIVSLVSNTGVVASDAPTTIPNRGTAAGAGYGGDKAIFGFGQTTNGVNTSNLVSNTGVLASDTPGVGTGRYGLAAAGYSTSP